MSGDKHTPGPWVLKNGVDVVSSDAPFWDIATVVGYAGPGDATPANARLIAAAPELLCVLNDVLEWSSSCNHAGHDGLPVKLMRRVLDAVNEAEGITHAEGDHHRPMVDHVSGQVIRERERYD